jgi:hypothetical protein
VSKVRKGSREGFDASDIFADREFDADTFVEQMDEKTPRPKTDSRAGWRRLEELKDEQMLRDQLVDWEDFGDKDAL